jgi:hypothetical protein
MAGKPEPGLLNARLAERHADRLRGSDNDAAVLRERLTAKRASRPTGARPHPSGRARERASLVGSKQRGQLMQSKLGQRRPCLGVWLVVWVAAGAARTLQADSRAGGRDGADRGLIPVVVTDACGAGDHVAAKRSADALSTAGDAILTDVSTLTGLLVADTTST